MILAGLMYFGTFPLIVINLNFQNRFDCNLGGKKDFN